MELALKQVAIKCPAPAGMIPSANTFKITIAEMPRTCGDDPREAVGLPPTIINAPHLRG